jgi:hypothetical protein
MKYKRKKYQLGGTYMPNEQEAKGEQQTQAMIGAVGAINPVIGVAMKAGQAIGNQTVDEHGLYKSKAGQFIDNSINPQTGIQNLKDVMKDPSASNIANQLSLGLIGKGATQKRREHAKDVQSAMERRALEMRMDAKVLGMNYDFTGNQEQGAIYQLGGKLKALNSDTVEVDGATHEQGGVKVAGAELEDKETVAGDFVFSDYLGFAEKHKPLAKQIGAIEKKPLNRERRVTMEILRKKEAALKQQQEGMKQQLGLSTGEVMQLGGHLAAADGTYSDVSGPWKDSKTMVSTLLGANQGFGKGSAYTDPEGFPLRKRDFSNPQGALNELLAHKSVGTMLDNTKEAQAKWKNKSLAGILSTQNKKFGL